MKGLLVVDMQNDFLDLENGALNLGHDTSALQTRVADFIKTFDGDVIVSYDTHTDNSCEFERLPIHCVKGTWGHQLAEPISDALREVNPLNLGTGDKNSFSGDKVVDEIGPLSELHVVGVCTHICVFALVSAYANKMKDEYNVLPKIVVHREMVDDFDERKANNALELLTDLYGVEVR